MKIYLATGLFEKRQGETLTKKRNKNRLLSFYHTIQKAGDFLNYGKTGKW